MPLIRQYPRLYKLIAVSLFNLVFLLTGTVWYSTTKVETRPEPIFIEVDTSLEAQPGDASQAGLPEQTGGGPMLGGITAALTPTRVSTFRPFLDIIPSEDGTEIFVSAGGVGQIADTVDLTIESGPSHDRGCYTMVFSDTIQAYVATATGFTPEYSTSGPMSITTTTGLDSGIVQFNRAYIPNATLDSVSSEDGFIELTLVNTDTFSSEAYMVIVPSYSPPGPLPADHLFVGSTYSVRASGALTAANRPLSLQFFYNATTLGSADPHTLALFSWEPGDQRWNNLDGKLFSTQQFMAVAAARFTNYALVATPVWRDDFGDFSGLDFSRFENVTFGGNPQDRTLVLHDMPGSGRAVSQPISPTLAFDNWDSLIFSGTVNPPITTLTVDILDLNDAEIITNVESGTNLADLIDPVQFPKVRLRVNLTSLLANESPALKEWQISWRTSDKSYDIYLPLIIR